jgi:hypothetical protein
MIFLLVLGSEFLFRTALFERASLVHYGHGSRMPAMGIFARAIMTKRPPFWGGRFLNQAMMLTPAALLSHGQV